MMTFDLDMIRDVYTRFPERVTAARELKGGPLTLAEKILYTHLWDGNPNQVYQRGVDYVDFAPDRGHAGCDGPNGVAQFMQAGKAKVSVPSTVRCDLIQAKVQADSDLQEAINKNNEVYGYEVRVEQVRHRILEAWCRDHSPGGLMRFREE